MTISCPHPWRKSKQGDPRLWICAVPPDKPIPGGDYETCPECGAACVRDEDGRIECYDFAPRAAEPRRHSRS